MIILDETTELVILDNADDDDDLDHYYCCNPDLALCGVDLIGIPVRDFPDAAPTTCVVCSDLQDVVCEVCGCLP